MNAGTIATIIFAIIMLACVLLPFSKPQGNFAKPDLTNFRARRSYAMHPDQNDVFPVKYESPVIPPQDSVNTHVEQECTHEGHYQVTACEKYALRWCTNCGKTWRCMGLLTVFDVNWDEVNA